jgi:hypothetical protein
MSYAANSLYGTVSISGIALDGESDGRTFAWSMEMLFISVLIFFFAAAISISAIAAIQYSQGISAGSASLAASNAAAAREPFTPNPPAGFPMYKGGAVAPAGGHNASLDYDIIFPLGSLDEVEDFYRGAMPASGWRQYVAASDYSLFLSSDGSRRASLSFKYYGGMASLHLTTSE